MPRVRISIAMLLLCAAGVAAGSISRSASGAHDLIIRGPTYRYGLKASRNSAVCQNMLRVFNADFAHLWNAPSLPWSKNDAAYSADSKYAFPLLPGIDHSTGATFEMRFSAQPTSPEFSSIHWKEGTAITGGCPAGKVCAREGPEPILVAHFDFDNDGTIDTVIKHGFSRGYRHVSGVDEYLTVLRDQTIEGEGVVDLTKLVRVHNGESAPVVWGSYLRPFIYQRTAYVARYVQNLGISDGGDSEPVPRPWTTPPDREDMLVQQYFSTEQKQNTTRRPEWAMRTICDFEMKQVSNR